MVLAKTSAGMAWDELKGEDCLTKPTSNHLPQLIDVSEQLNLFDQNEAIYLSSEGIIVMRVCDLIEKINMRVARYQSLASLSVS